MRRREPKPRVGQRARSIENPVLEGTVTRVRMATRRSFWHTDVKLDCPTHPSHGQTIRSISTCWHFQ